MFFIETFTSLFDMKAGVSVFYNAQTQTLKASIERNVDVTWIVV